MRYQVSCNSCLYDTGYTLDSLGTAVRAGEMHELQGGDHLVTVRSAKWDADRYIYRDLTAEHFAPNFPEGI